MKKNHFFILIFIICLLQTNFKAYLCENKHKNSSQVVSKIINKEHQEEDDSLSSNVKQRQQFNFPIFSNQLFPPPPPPPQPSHISLPIQPQFHHQDLQETNINYNFYHNNIISTNAYNPYDPNIENPNYYQNNNVYSTTKKNYYSFHSTTSKYNHYYDNDNSEDYAYILPSRKVASCPSFASFKFSCQQNHLISIENLVFSPVHTNKSGECVSDWTSECSDSPDSASFNYLVKECAGKETCTLIAYQLRSRTKCTYHQVISIIYKCVPTWEIKNVPIKCDICKNVTINYSKNTHNGLVGNYGFIHSAWYPKLYPRVTCHSLIKNKPDHFIIIYSVSGSIGLDRIQIESINEFGFLMLKELLTGNLTTRLVLTSPYDVNVTVLTEDTYFYNNRRFLLYFYLVPKCFVILCANMTAYPPPLSHTTSKEIITHLPYHNTPSATTSKSNNFYQEQIYTQYYFTTLPTSKSTTPFYSTSTFISSTTMNTTASIANSTYDHAMHNTNDKPSKVSDAWLAAILALVYALLMVFAVITAIYCRRRRRRRQLLEQYNQSKVIFSPSQISTSQIINPLSRTHSQISLTQNNHHHIVAPPTSQQYIYRLQSQNNMGSSMLIDSESSMYDHQSANNIYATQGSVKYHQQQTNDVGSLLDFNNIYSHVSNNINNNSGRDNNCFYVEGLNQDLNQQQHQNYEFDNYSQVITSTDIEDNVNQHMHIAPSSLAASYSFKTDTQLGSIIASNLVESRHASTSSANSSTSGAIGATNNNLPVGAYRAVEYTKSPHMERVRVKTSLDEHQTHEDFDATKPNIINQNQVNYDLNTEETFTREEIIQHHMEYHNKQYANGSTSDDQTEKTFIVKLFPLDEQEKEVQEMTLFVESSTTKK